LPSQSTGLQQPQLINPQQPASPQPAATQQPSQPISPQQAQSTSLQQATTQQPSQPISPQQPQPVSPQPSPSESPIDSCSQALQRFGMSGGQREQTPEQALGEINSHLQEHELRPLSPEQMREFCARAQPF
jgi:uncharacterized protein YkwD